ncbi:MAG: phosphoribosyl-AMP cyclohydrolase, partial [Enterococcus sp.]
MEIKNLKFDEQGLISCVVQDFYTNQVLTVAYMNEESLTKTLETQQMTFYSRSRQKLWR